MKNKIISLVAIIMLSLIFFSGCDNLIRSYHRAFSEVELEETSSVWDFYGSVQEAKNSVNYDVNTMRSSKAYGYEELFDALDSKKMLDETLTNGIIALDSHANNQSLAHYVFEDKKNYQIEKVSSIEYKISYDKSFSFCNIIEKDLQVDAILEKILFPTEVTLNVNKTQIKEESKLTFKTLTINLPKDNLILSLKEQVNQPAQIINGNEVQIVLETTSQNNSSFSAVITKTIKQMQEEIYKYEKTIELVKGSHIKITTELSQNSTTLNVSKVIPIHNPVVSSFVTFNHLEGSLQWNLIHKSYNDEGSVKFEGEAYYQGVNKFLLQERVELSSEDSNVLNFENSFTIQHETNGELYNFKMTKTTNPFKTIKGTNIFKFAVYDNEVQALTFQKTSADGLPEFKKFG